MFKLSVSLFICIFIVTDNVTSDSVESLGESAPDLEFKEIATSVAPETIEPKSNYGIRDRDINSLKDTVKALNDQLQTFNSLYIGRLDQKLMSINSNVASIDSNVRNIQERAHVWDTFQLHVSAWNDQIKSLDRKVDIINSGQEKMTLLEGKLSILLNLEYNSARIVNKLTSMEDRLEQMERTLRRQQSDISSMNQRDSFTESLTSRNIPNVVKAIDRKADRLIGMIQRSSPLGRRFARGRHANDTNPLQKILIKCSTPPTVEEIVKDVASKVDLIYDKIITDNISNDNCNNEDDGNSGDNPEEIEEEIDPDYSLLLFQTNEDDSEEKQFKRQSRQVHNQNLTKSRNDTRARKKRYDSDFTNVCHSEINDVKSLIRELSNHITSVQNIEGISTNIEFIKELLDDTMSTDVTSKNIDKRIKQLNINFNNICSYLQDEYTTGVQSEIKRYCHIFLSQRKKEKIDILTKCLKEGVPVSETRNTTNQSDNNISNKWIHTNNSMGNNETSTIFDEFTDICRRYIKTFEKILIRDIESPEQLTCFIVYSYIKNKSLEICAEPRPRFCDEHNFIMFQSRMDAAVSFSRSWKEYKWGFGDFKTGNYWIGNEALHVLTKDSRPAILRIDIGDFESQTGWAEYDRFSISSESEGFRLQVSGYRGNSSDSLSYHNGAAFSTVDVRHDEAPACCPCANSYGGGGWWYKSCFESNLNGIFFIPPRHPVDGGISWELWRSNSTLSRSTMSLGILRPSIFNNYDTEDP